MRKIISATLVAACAFALALGIAGCGGGKAADDPNTLTIVGNSSNLENVYLQRIFDLYEDKTGNKLNIISIENEGYDEGVKEAIADSDTPDLVMLFNNSILAGLGGTDQFVDLEDQPWVADLEDGALAYSSGPNGEILGLPFWESSVSGCYYNKKILDSLGLRPATNQAEFDRLCAALKSAGYTPICLGNEGCYSTYQFGLDPIVADNPEVLEALNSGELVYSEIPEVVSMVEWMKMAYDNGWFGDTLKLRYDEWGAAMGNGDAVMAFVWNTWFDTDFVPGKYTVDDFGLMPVFIGTVDEGTYEGGNLDMFVVNKDSGKQELALEFLEFCATPENYNIAFDGISTVSVFKGQTTNVESPMVIEMADSIAQKERVSTAEPKIVGYNARLVNRAIHQYFTNEITLEQCLKLMDDSLTTE